MRSILVIGGTGMIGRPVVRRLVEEGLHVRVMARRVDEVASMLPNKVETFPGNVRDIESIRKASIGMECVYINLSTTDRKDYFRPELHGTFNVIKAVKGNKNTVIAKLSGLTTLGDKLFPDAEEKLRADEAIKESGNPYLLFPASWFMESLPLFVKKGKFAIFGSQPHPIHWISADDYGKMVAVAVRKGYKDKVFPIQGANPLTFQEAAERFIAAFDKNITISNLPLPLMRILGMFKPKLRYLYHLMNHYQKNPEKFFAQESWKVLHKPDMTIEGYVEYMKAEIEKQNQRA